MTLDYEKLLTQKKRHKKKQKLQGPARFDFPFFFFIKYFFEMIPRENSYQMSSCIGSAQTKKKFPVVKISLQNKKEENNLSSTDMYL